jgi:hypothetical protein
VNQPQATLADVLDSVHSLMCFDVRDWSNYRRDAWLYGIFVGWGCDDHADPADHDDICGGDEALHEVAAMHGWNAAAVARLQSYRAVIAELSGA